MTLGGAYPDFATEAITGCRGLVVRGTLVLSTNAHPTALLDGLTVDGCFILDGREGIFALPAGLTCPSGMGAFPPTR